MMLDNLKLGINRRSPHGERGLKHRGERVLTAAEGRSPHGERGLKPQQTVTARRKRRSLPTRGAWIETLENAGLGKFPCGRSPHGERGLKQLKTASRQRLNQSLPTRGAWIETIAAAFAPGAFPESLPTRGAWIETSHSIKSAFGETVAPHTGSVD